MFAPSRFIGAMLGGGVRELAADQSTATAGQDRRTAGETCALLLAFLVRDISIGGGSGPC
jgi:hypothetical protein